MSERENRLKIRNRTFSNKIDLDIYVEWDALSEIIWVDCRFEDLNLLGTIFGSCNFKNCEFFKSDLYASDFRRCKLFQIKFKNSNLNLLLARSVKVWKSKQWIEIEKSSNLEKILKDMNLIISTDQDKIKNS